MPPPVLHSKSFKFFSSIFCSSPNLASVGICTMAMATPVHIFVCIEGSEAAKVRKVMMLLGCYSLVKVSVVCAYTLLVWRIHSDHSLKFHFLQKICMSSARQFCVLCGHNWRNGWLSISFSLDSYRMSHVNIKGHFWVLFWKTLVKCIYISVHLCEIRMLQVFVCFQFEFAVSYQLPDGGH